MTRTLSCLLVLLSVLVSVNSALAENNASANKVFLEGTHYSVLEQSLPNGVATVAEFIYYGCKVCFQIAPVVSQWSATSGVSVSLIPAHSKSAMMNEARMFHTFEVMGVLPVMYEDGYIIFQTDQSNLQGADRVNGFLENKGINKDEFWKAWGSAEVNERLNSSAELTSLAKISKTPTFVVHGKYKIDIESLKSVDELFELLSYLIKKAPSAAPSLLRRSPN